MKSESSPKDHHPQALKAMPSLQSIETIAWVRLLETADSAYLDIGFNTDAQCSTGMSSALAASEVHAGRGPRSHIDMHKISVDRVRLPVSWVDRMATVLLFLELLRTTRMVGYGLPLVAADHSGTSNMSNALVLTGGMETLKFPQPCTRPHNIGRRDNDVAVGMVLGEHPFISCCLS